MAQGDRATLGLAVIATPSLTIGGIRNWRLANELARTVEGSGGLVDPSFVSIMAAKNRLTFETLQLTALSSCGISGCQVTTAAFYLQKLAPYGTRTAGSTHTKLTVATGFLMPRRLTWAKGQAATIEYELAAISSNGTTAPVGILANQALPGGGGVGEMFAAGPVSFNGTEMDIDRITIDFGLRAEGEGSGGQVYDTFISVMERRPVITLTTADLDAIATIGIEGLAQTATDSLIYFRKKAPNGLFVADDQQVHIKIALDDGLLTMDSGGAVHGDRATMEVTYTPIYDGTNAIMAIAVDSAIP